MFFQLYAQLFQTENLWVLALPFLWSYSSHKLEQYLKACPFLGYSNIHNSYICFEPIHKFYFFRRVQFDEASFPSLPTFTKHDKINSHILQSWYFNSPPLASNSLFYSLPTSTHSSSENISPGKYLPFFGHHFSFFPSVQWYTILTPSHHIICSTHSGNIHIQSTSLRFDQCLIPFTRAIATYSSHKLLHIFQHPTLDYKFFSTTSPSF